MVVKSPGPRGTRPRRKGDCVRRKETNTHTKKKGKEKEKVVRGIWLWHIVVVLAVGVELYTPAAGQAATALDLPRLAGFASGR